jgi:hypothetical protein
MKLWTCPTCGCEISAHKRKPHLAGQPHARMLTSAVIQTADSQEALMRQHPKDWTHIHRGWLTLHAFGLTLDVNLAAQDELGNLTVVVEGSTRKSARVMQFLQGEVRLTQNHQPFTF